MFVTKRVTKNKVSTHEIDTDHIQYEHVVAENEIIKKSCAEITLYISRLYEKYIYAKTTKEVYRSDVNVNYSHNESSKSSSAGYNIEPKFASFDVEKPIIRKEDPTPLTPVQLRRQNDAYEWKRKLRTISKARVSKQKKTLNKYSKLALNGFPLYLKSYPLCPKFQTPLETGQCLYIYALVDATDNTVRYVGQTNNLAQQSAFHKKHTQGHPALWQWKKSTNFNFSIYVLCKISYTDRNKAVKQWVEYLRQIGKIYNKK